MSRRALFKTTVAAIAGLGLHATGVRSGARRRAARIAREMRSRRRFDFEATGVDGWTVIDGQWTVEEMPGAPSGKKVLVQRATRNPFRRDRGAARALRRRRRVGEVRSRSRAARMPPAASSFGLRMAATTSSAPTRSRTTSGCMPYDRGGGSSPAPASSRQRSASGTASASWRWAITCRRGSTARSISTIATRASNPVASACGRRRIRSRLDDLDQPRAPARESPTSPRLTNDANERP